MAGQRQIPNHAMPCHAMHMIVFPEISRISACTRALGAYLHSKCNLSRTDEVFSFHFVRWGHGARGRGAASGLGPERHCSRWQEITNEKRTERERGERTESQEISTRKVVISNLAYTHHCTVPV